MSEMPHDLAYVRITSADTDAFAQFFAIYEASMPASERKPRDVIAALVRRQDYHVLGLKADNAVIAFLIAFVSATESMSMLEYMATKDSNRNRGLGAQLFAKAAELAGSRPMLVEVDSEREDAPDQSLRLRRKSFYIRNGCRQLPHLDYFMPLVGEAKPPVMDLLLYWPGHDDAPSPSLVRRWLECVYAEVYGCARNDPRIETMVRDYAGGSG